MQSTASTYQIASPVTGRKITRHELADHLGFSLRYIDELTHNGTLPFYKIGKSVRYDLAQVETTLNERFLVKPKIRRVHRALSIKRNKSKA